MASFASTTDMADKAVSFDELGPGLYAYTAEGDPKSGVIVGNDGVVVVDVQATPAMAQDVMARVADVTDVTDRKVTQIVLSHYHAVRVLGASDYGARVVIASDATRALLTRGDVEQGLADTEAFTSTLFALVQEGVAKGWGLRDIYRDTVDRMRPRFGTWVIFDHCMPFNVSRAHDQAQGTTHPRIWIAERDLEMWRTLEGDAPPRSAEARG